MLSEAKATRQQWQELTAPWLKDGQPQPERALVLRHVDGKQHWVDPLLLSAQIRPVDD